MALILSNLATALSSQGDEDGAEELLRQSLAMRRRLMGDAHPDVAHNLINLAEVLGRKGEPDVAEPLYRESVRILDQRVPAAHPMLHTGRLGLGETLKQLRRFMEAEPVLLAAHETAPASELSRSTQALIDLYDAWHAADPGSGHDARAAEWRTRLDEPAPSADASGER